MNKRLLYITDTPYKAKSGGGTNCSIHYDIVKSQFKNNMYSVFACEKSDKLYDENAIQGFTCSSAEKMEAILKGYPPYLTRSVRKTIWDFIDRYQIDIVYIENSVSGNFVKKIKQKKKKIIVVCFFHDIESVLMQTWISKANLMRKISLKTMILNEKETVKYADKKIVLNDRDFNLYKKIYGKEPDYIIPISVPVQDKNLTGEKHVRGKVLNLLFVGADYQPNIDAVKWYIDEIADGVRNKAKLTVVGYKMEKYKSVFEHENVIIKGTVDDLTKFYVDSDIVIAPLFSGGGMKIKTAEALSYGKIFVGTDESLTGYWESVPERLRNKFVFKENTALEYIELFNDMYEKTFDKYNDDIRDWMFNYYSLNANMKRYEKIWLDLI